MGFSVPASFIELQVAGRFDYWGAPYRSLTSEQRALLYPQRRHEVLWLETIEWDRDLTAEAIAAAPEDERMLPGLVRFAGNGAGDDFCWYVPWQDGPEPPVLFCPHDEDRARYFAPDFAGCLERLWLQHGAIALRETDAPDEVAADLAAYLTIIEPHLGPGRAAALSAVNAQRDAAGFEAAEKALVAGFARAGDVLIGHNLMSTRYTLKFLGRDALRLYDQSIAFYESLVAAGHQRFEAALAETRANRAAAVEELG